MARMNQIARQVSIYGRVIDINETLNKIESINLNHIKEFIEKTFIPEKMTISALGAIKTLRAKEDILSFYK